MFSPTPYNQLGTGFTSILGLSNIFTYIKQVDYFAPSTLLNPFLHTWSLGVEEQFYIIFPFIIWFTNFYQNKTTLKLKSILLFLSTLSLISFIYFYTNKFEASYYLMPNRFWEISIGSLIFLYINSNSSLLSISRRFLVLSC